MIEPTKDLFELLILNREPKSTKRPVTVERCSRCQHMARTGDWCSICGALETAEVERG